MNLNSLTIESTRAAIAQKQFWPATDLRAFGDGRTRDVLSVIISNWDTPGTFVDKPARECTPEEIRFEVWEQLKAHVGALHDRLLVDWYLAESITQQADGSLVNREPLMINTAGSWAVPAHSPTPAGERIRASTAIPLQELSALRVVTVDGQELLTVPV